MDARQRRTRESLRRAIYDLASQRPAGSLTVAEVARAAGVTRDTFYRHAASPVTLLASVLEEEINAIPLPRHGGAEAFVRAEDELLRHVAAHVEVYRAALVDGSDGSIRDVLHRAIALRLEEYLIAHPEIAPVVPGGLGPGAARTVFVAYAAAGTVGGITQWLRGGGGEDDIPAFARTVVAAGPAWWLLPTPYPVASAS